MHLRSKRRIVEVFQPPPPEFHKLGIAGAWSFSLLDP